MVVDPVTVRSALLACLRDRFSLEELQDIAFVLGVDFELFHHQDKASFSRELVSYFERRDKLACLAGEALRRRRDEQLAALLADLPPCQPPVRVQVVIDPALVGDSESLKRALAGLFGVPPAEVSLIAAAWDSMRLLIGLPAAVGNVHALSRLVTLQHPTAGAVSAIAFAALDLISQKTWQLIACAYPPSVRGGKLQAAISWADALRQISRQGCALYLAHSYTPSALLYTANLPAFAQELLQRAGEHRQAGDWERAERCARDARQYFEQAHDQAGVAVALIHLADIHRERGQTGLLLAEAQEAYHLLQAHPALEQRHNEAVAAYNLGLVHYLLGNNSQARAWHRTAQEAFETARKTLWLPRRELDWAGRCVEMRERLEAMNKALVYPAALPRRTVVSKNSTFSTAQLSASDYVLGQQLTIGGATFQVYSLTGSDVAIVPDGEYHVIKAPPQACLLIGARAGDYMLARETKKKDPFVPYSIARIEGEFALGHFERDPADPARWFFLSVDARTIGGSGEAPLYHPIALLRPTRLPPV